MGRRGGPAPVGFKLRVVVVDSGVMRPVVTILLVSLVVAACGSAVEVDPSVVPSGTVPAASSATATSGVAPIPPSQASASAEGGGLVEGSGPEYDVFLAAVAEVLVGTRFEDTPLEDPEVFTATGLLLCERMESGAVGDEVVFEYLTELTGGDAGLADDDQLMLSGALLGAAGEALCPQIKPSNTLSGGET